MPPFELPLRRATLTFETGSLVGLEIDANMDLSVDLFLELSDKFNKAVDKKTGWEPLRELMAWFADHVALGWNLHEAGEPVPFSAEEFTSRLSGAQGMAIVRRYIEALRGNSRPLSPRSASGGTSKGRRASRSQPSSNESSSSTT